MSNDSLTLLYGYFWLLLNPYQSCTVEILRAIYWLLLLRDAYLMAMYMLKLLGFEDRKLQIGEQNQRSKNFHLINGRDEILGHLWRLIQRL